MNSTINSAASTKSALITTFFIGLSIDGCCVAVWAVRDHHSVVTGILEFVLAIAAIVVQFFSTPVDPKKYISAVSNKKLLHILVIIFIISFTPFTIWTDNHFFSHIDQKSVIIPKPNLPTPKATILPPTPSPTALSPTPSPTALSPTIQSEQGTLVPANLEVHLSGNRIRQLHLLVSTKTVSIMIDRKAMAMDLVVILAQYKE